MELAYWWLSLILVLLLISSWLFLKFRRKKASKKPRSSSKPLANSYRLARLPEYQDAIKKYHWIIRGLSIVMALSLFASIVLSGRLTSVTITEPEMKNRDIILCLDVSGSMYEANGELTKLYSEAVKGFDGERIGMVVFDSSPITIFPLTNDYDFASSQLKELADLFTGSNEEFTSNNTSEHTSYNRLYRLLEGVNEGSGSSLIGDGLASCVNRFDRLDSKRSRSIVFGTDNYVVGSPIVTLPEAADIAKNKDVRVYGINPDDYTSTYSKDPIAEEFKKAMLYTNGDYYSIKEMSIVPTIVRKITEQEATRFKGSPQIIYSDQPLIPGIVLLVGVCLLMFAAWRLRL